MVCWILLLQIINISINPPDIYHPKKSTITRTEDLSVNDIESVYELISENVFGKEVPESNEDEVDSASSVFELFFHNRMVIQLPPLDFPVTHFSFYSPAFSSIHQEIISPPPKAA